MALGPEFDQPVGRSARRFDGVVDRGQERLFRILWFALPPGSVARNVDFQALMASRFLSDLALQALLFAALIASARAGGSAIQAALIGVAFLLPGVVLGPFGGAVADALPKRLALVTAYLVMGLLAIFVPFTQGTGFVAMLLVLFTVRILHQVSQPAEASAAPMVASREELASANSFLSLASSAGEVAGKALLAPLVVRFWGLQPVTVMAGLLFILSAFRVVKFSHHADQGTGRSIRDAALRPRGVREAVDWVLHEPGALWMLLFAAMASTVGVVLGTLGPQYVRDVLNVDPANTFYVFAPASLGVVLGLVVAPFLIRVFRERQVAFLGFTIVSFTIAGYGQIDRMTSTFRRLLVIDIPRVGERVETAAALALVLGLGMTLAAAATQTYIGRNVPVAIHGRVFALLGALKDGLAMPQLLLLGAVAGAIGVGRVMTIAPFALLLVALVLARYARLRRERTAPSRLGVLPQRRGRRRGPRP
jgi:MFS family permease